MTSGRQLLAWALAGAALVAAAVGVVAQAAPDRHHNPPPSPTYREPRSGGPLAGGGSRHTIGLPGWVMPLIIAVALLLVLWLASRIRVRPRRARRRRAGPEAVDYAAVAEELARTAAVRRQLLEGTDPRAGVLQAWLDLQTAAERSGLPREDAETSTEFTARVLSVWAVDPEALRTLAAAYREAHFSDHPIGEDARAQVGAALDRVEAAIADHAPVAVA